MGDFNRIEGNVEVPLPDGGVLYLRGRVRNTVKGKYESWLEGQARRRCFDAHYSGELSPEEFKQSLAVASEVSGAQTFAWGGDAWKKSLTMLPGIVKMITLLAQDAMVDTPQKVDESTVFGWYSQRLAAREEGGSFFLYDKAARRAGPFKTEKEADEAAAASSMPTLLVQTLQEVIYASPNFICPPIRGVED